MEDNVESEGQDKVEGNKGSSNEVKPRFSGIKGIIPRIKKIYEGQYKKLLIIPFSLLLIAILLIGLKFAITGDFINRDVSLKGGVTVTIQTKQQIDILQLKETISSKFPENDISTKYLSRYGSQVGVIVDVDIGEENREEQIDTLIEELGKALNLKLTTNDYSIEIVGSSLGASFFREVIRALLVAFFLMDAIVFLYFGPSLKLKLIVSLLSIFSSILIFANKGLLSDIAAFLFGIILIYIFLKWSIPSFAVILSVFSDIIITLSIVNLLGMKLGIAGIAAFLMLIGYSVDTNILLSIRVLKRKEGTEMERIYGAFKTGITMSLTTIIALSAALIFTQSEVIRQIMIILLIGLAVDLINTWIQNAGILRLYLERKAKKSMMNNESQT